MTIDRRTILRGAAALSAAGALGTAAGQAQAAAPSLRNWMAALPGDTPLHRLTLPGTHDSAARHGGPWVACQDEGIARQLRGGTRFLDIRCRAFEGSFSLHHGAFYQHLNFDDVLLACRGFLQENPSETVLMRLKQEYSEEPPEVFGSLFESYLDGPHRWRELLHIDDGLPLLGRARGRVVLLADDPGLPGVRFGAPELFDVQDSYQVPPHRKFGLVAEQFRRAVKEPGKLFVNFVSTAALLPPRSNAEELNPRVKDLLSGPAPDGAGSWQGLGIVPMDFPAAHGATAALVRHQPFPSGELADLRA